MNIFLNRLNGEPIGVSVLGIFVVDKNTILAVRISKHAMQLQRVPIDRTQC